MKEFHLLFLLAIIFQLFAQPVYFSAPCSLFVLTIALFGQSAGGESANYFTVREMA